MALANFKTFTIAFTAINKHNQDVRIAVGGRWCPPYWDEDTQQTEQGLQEVTQVSYGGDIMPIERVASKLGMTERKFRKQVLQMLLGKLEANQY